MTAFDALIVRKKYLMRFANDSTDKYRRIIYETNIISCTVNNNDLPYVLRMRSY